MKAGYARNKQLIDLTQIPQHLAADITTAFDEAPIPEKKHLRDYFIKHQLNTAESFIGDL
jgi:hypothetical protein